MEKPGAAEAGGRLSSGGRAALLGRAGSPGPLSARSGSSSRPPGSEEASSAVAMAMGREEGGPSPGGFLCTEGGRAPLGTRSPGWGPDELRQRVPPANPPRPSSPPHSQAPLPSLGTGKPGHLGFLWLVAAGRGGPFRLSPPPHPCQPLALMPDSKALGLCLPGPYRSGTPGRGLHPQERGHQILGVLTLESLSKPCFPACLTHL